MWDVATPLKYSYLAVLMHRLAHAHCTICPLVSHSLWTVKWKAVIIAIIKLLIKVIWDNLANSLYLICKETSVSYALHDIKIILCWTHNNMPNYSHMTI